MKSVKRHKKLQRNIKNRAVLIWPIKHTEAYSAGNYLPLPQGVCSPPKLFWHPPNTALPTGWLGVVKSSDTLTRCMSAVSLGCYGRSYIVCMKKYSYILNTWPSHSFIMQICCTAVSKLTDVVLPFQGYRHLRNLKSWKIHWLYWKNCIQSIQCCISRRSKTAKIKCYKL